MERIIVSRHPAAVAFIRADRPDFADVPALASAEPADIRRKLVAGNIPLYLAKLASSVLAIEFSGAPPRGAEYTIEDMRAAGAHLVEYGVYWPHPPTGPSDQLGDGPSAEEAELAARTISHSDRPQPRGHTTALVVGNATEMALFAGEHIPGLVVVHDAGYEKNGKWSGTDYTLHLARKGGWHLDVGQEWNGGRRLADHPGTAGLVRQFRDAGCPPAIEDAAIVAFVEAHFPDAHERAAEYDEADASL